MANYLTLLGYVLFILGGIWLIERFLAWVEHRVGARKPTIGAPLCADCGVPLAPHEHLLDTGDGDELVCDGCLFGPRSN